MEVTGTMHAIMETQHVSDRFTKREFVVTVADNPKYPQMVLFQATKERCGQLDEFREGDDVRVTFNLRGREWRSPKGEVKYFTSLEAWRIERVGQTQTQSRTGYQPRSAANEPAPAQDNPSDDIPF